MSMSSIHWFSVDEYQSFIRERSIPIALTEGASFGFSLTSIDDLLQQPNTRIPLDGLGDAYIWIGVLDTHPFVLYQSFVYPDFSWLELPQELSLDPVTIVKFVIKIHIDLLPYLSWIKNPQQEWGIFLLDIDAAVVYCPMSGLSKEQALAIQDLLKQQPSIKYPVIVAMTEGLYLFEQSDLTNQANQPTCSKLTFKVLPHHPNADIHKIHPYSPQPPSWALMRQDDNNNIFHIQDFEYHIDALIAQIDYENRGHKQLYFVEPIHQKHHDHST